MHQYHFDRDYVMMTFKIQAIKKLTQNVTHFHNDVPYDKDDKLVIYDEGKVNAEIARLQKDWDNKQYQRDRLKEYPDLQECIHAILDDDLTALQAKRKLVKEKYPKPE